MTGFPFIVGLHPRIVILGTFPGKESLIQKQYYANPRNLFWRIMGCICGAGVDKDYETRTSILKETGICLWDVLKSCDRDGTSDAKIRNVRLNDFATFLSHYHTIEALFFNGKKAKSLFPRGVIRKLQTSPSLFYLPSTSPANTRMTNDDKLRQWCIIKSYIK